VLKNFSGLASEVYTHDRWTCIWQ